MLRRYFEVKVRAYEKHLPWMPKWTKAANETALGVTERKGVNVPSDAWKIPEGLMVVEMRFRASGESPDDKSGTAHVYAARYKTKDNVGNITYDDISHLGDIALTIGQQEATEDSSYYAQTAVPTQRWMVDLHLADATGLDGMARIAFDITGYDCLFVKMEHSTLTWYIDVSGFTKL